MKIIASLLVVAAALPVSVSIITADIADIKSAILNDEHTITYLVSQNLTSEPAMMFFVGMGLIALAGIGRKKLNKRNNNLRKQKDFRYTMPPYPDPVPWKKE